MTTINKKENINFAICISTYKRKNGNTLFYLTRCLDSVLKQTYKNWKLYVYGDKYEDENEFNKILSQIPQDKLVKHNMNIDLERQSLTGHKLWATGGINTMNTMRQQALDDGFEWICHLDDDDFWHHERLSTINQMLNIFPEACFITNYSTWNGTLLPALKQYNIHYNNLPIHGGCCIHSTFIMNKRFLKDNRMKNIYEYKENEELEAGDWQTLENLKKYLINNPSEKILFIPSVLTFHPKEGESKEIK